MANLTAALTSSHPHFRQIIHWPDRIPYLIWRTGLLGHGQRVFSLATGEKLVMRRREADIWTATEVFLLEEYHPPVEVRDVRRIADLGANVGYATIYLARRFSNAQIDAFEPHPTHLTQLRANVSANALDKRVTIHPCAACCRQEMLFLSDDATESRIVSKQTTRSLSVQGIDWPHFAMSQNIDLLKMDIEGGEYDILFDSRFAALNIPNIVLEWHATPERPNADVDIAGKLASLGYTVKEPRAPKAIPGLRFGIFWAIRTDQQGPRAPSSPLK